MNLNDDPRALQRAQNAEIQRIQRANRGSLEEEYNHRRARRNAPGVLEHKSAQQSVAREDGMTRQNENNLRRSRRNTPGVQEHKAAQQLSAREEPGV